ncbi:MAG: peptide chain release factor N(5)-glutamine methyltransferase, partial [Myxococcota bacterium]
IRVRDRHSLMADVVDHEPALALFGEGDDGLGVHRRVLAGVHAMLRPGGAVILEAGFDQGDELMRLPRPGLGEACLYRDLAGNIRGAQWTAEER